MSTFKIRTICLRSDGAPIDLALTASAKSTCYGILGIFRSPCREMEKPRRRYKRRWKDHHPTANRELFGASRISSASERSRRAEPETLQPMIIAEMQTKIATLAVGEAVSRWKSVHRRVLFAQRRPSGGEGVMLSTAAMMATSRGLIRP